MLLWRGEKHFLPTPKGCASPLLTFIRRWKVVECTHFCSKWIFRRSPTKSRGESTKKVSSAARNLSHSRAGWVLFMTLAMAQLSTTAHTRAREKVSAGVRCKRSLMHFGETRLTKRRNYLILSHCSWHWNHNRALNASDVLLGLKLHLQTTTRRFELLNRQRGLNKKHI